MSIYWYFKLVNVENTNKLIFKSEKKKYEMLEIIVKEHRFTYTCEETIIWSLYEKYKQKFPEPILSISEIKDMFNTNL